MTAGKLFCMFAGSRVCMTWQSSIMTNIGKINPVF